MAFLTTASTNEATVAAQPSNAGRQSVSPRRGEPRVLVIRPSALGDVFRMAPAVVTLRRALPEARIECLVQQGSEAALAHHPDVDDIVTFTRRPKRRWYGPRHVQSLCGWARELARCEYDLVIDLQGLARSGLMTWATRSLRRVGFANARELAWLFYNRRHHVPASMHHVDRLLALLEAEGYAPSHDARLYVGEDDDAWCGQLLARHGWSAQPFTCLAPTSRWKCKCWPGERYVEIGRRLIESGSAGGRLVVLHAPSERTYVEPLIEALGRVAGSVAGGESVIAPVTTVGQMMALVRRSALGAVQ